MDDREYELKRRDLIQMLQTYKDERHNIERLKRLAIQEAEADLYPAGTDYSKDRVQCSTDSGDMAENNIYRLENSRKHLSAVLQELNQRTANLDRLLFEITKLPAYQGRVIIGLYIDGNPEHKVASEMNKSEATISGYRKHAIRKLTRSMFGCIRSWRADLTQ